MFIIILLKTYIQYIFFKALEKEKKRVNEGKNLTDIKQKLEEQV